jgi:hypothetical protein
VKQDFWNGWYELQSAVAEVIIAIKEALEQ